MTPLERLYDNNEVLDMLQDEDEAGVEEIIDNLRDADLDAVFDLAVTFVGIISDARLHRTAVQGKRNE